jgi:hypothetical protein
MLALEIRYLASEPTSVIYRTGRHLVLGHDSISNGDPVIVLSERRRLVNDTGSRGSLYVRITDNSVCPIFELFTCCESEKET